MRKLMVGMLLTYAAMAFSQGSAPIPSQFASGKTAFLAFAGAPSVTDVEREQTRVLYSSLYSGIQTAARYKLVDQPSVADLCMEFSIVEHESFSGFRLAMYDCKIHALLWTLDEVVRPAFRNASLQKNIEASIGQLMADLDTLANGSAPGALKVKNQKQP